MTVTIDDLDRDLERYRSAADTVSANLLEIDGDPNRQLLETAPLTGTTAGEWADARHALTSVWDWFARFATFLDQAAELRVSPRTRLAPGRERALADFLSQPSIELGSDEIPLQDRDLLQPRRATSRCTADELLGLMSDAFARAREVVSRIGAAWDDLAPRLARARAALTDVSGVERSQVEQQLEALTEALVTDPLAVTEAAVHDAEQSVAALTRAAAAARALRDEWQDRLRAAREELGRVEQEVAGARAAHATTTVKILEPSVPDPPAVDHALAAALDHVVGLADAGRWDDAVAQLDQWSTTLQRRADAAAASTTACRAPMIERDQLRGLLDAYRAKAHGLGLDEDDDVADAYQHAQAALYVAPADLASARRLVERYQRLLTTDHEPEARR
jgi:hypothetical protein